MATKSIITRIKNKVDSLSAWQSYTGTLLNGEIAIVRVPTGEEYTNPVTGKTEPVVELLMKVGDGSTAFASLPWLSAKASDVYNWAKLEAATDIPVTINDTVSTLGAYLAKVDTNTANISSNTDKINTLNGSDSTVGSVAKAIKDAIGKLDYSSTSDATDSSTSKIAFVTAVTQADGKIAVKKRNIIEADLPDISASKIKVDANTKLDTKLTSMDALIKANTDKLTGHTDDEINTLITNKINTLDGGTDSGSAGSGKYVSKVVQTNGKVATTYTSFPTASTSAAGIAKLGATGGAATYDSIFGSDGTGGINAQVNTNKSDIASLKNAVAGGVHFIGTVTAKPTAASVTVNGASTSITASAGDVVIWTAEGIEYIYTGSAWEELGDVDRIGALETKINNLDVTATNAVSTTHKFVSQVTQTDGKVAVTYTQPTSADVSHDGSTVKVALENLAAGKSDNHDHPYLPNTTKYAGSSSIGGAATSANKVNKSITIKLNSGTTDDTNLFTFDGSVAKTIDITPSAIGAAAASHAHDDKYYTEAEIDAKVQAINTAINGKAASSHNHGNILSGGTITSTVVTSATGVLVYDSNNKIQRATAAQTRAIIGAGTSSLTLGTTATTAAKGNHTHSTYEANIKGITDNYVRVDTNNKLVHHANSTDTEIILDCGGAN
jgi:hypothetical protein